MIRFITCLLLLAATSQIALAQPATEAAAKTALPANAANGLNEEQKQKMLAKMDELAKMTPEQRQAQMRDLTHEILRSTLLRAGFSDKALQEAIVTFVDEQEKSRDEVRRAAAKVYLATEPRGVATDDRGLEILVEDYLSAVEEAKTERAIAVKALDAEIGLGAKPRLRAVLLLNGIIGDAAPMTNDIILGGSMVTGTLAGGGFLGTLGAR